MENIDAHFLDIGISEFLKYKAMGDKAIQRLSEEELHYQPDAESNSMAIMIRHMSGNMISRWTDFLTTDGEKPDRHRDSEFEDHRESKEELIAIWEKGWKVFIDTLHSLKPSDMMATVYIRREPHTVVRAIIRQLTHYGYHVGQMVYLAKQVRSSSWESLSIPKGKSEEFNAAMK